MEGREGRVAGQESPIAQPESGVQLQFPIGRLLYAAPAPRWISRVRVSPRSDRLAFIEHAVEGDTHGDLRVVDVQGRVTTVSAGYSAVNGLAWSPDGSELLVSGSRTGGGGQRVGVVTLSGRERVGVEVAGELSLRDVSRRGDMLISRGTTWTEVRARARGAAEEAELPAGDLSFLSDLSDGGARILGTDIGEGSGPNYAVYVQGTDGSAPVWLGEGDGQALSPDGRSASHSSRTARPSSSS